MPKQKPEFSTIRPPFIITRVPKHSGYSLLDSKPDCSPHTSQPDRRPAILDPNPS